jgi:hypothetical protein
MFVLRGCRISQVCRNIIDIEAEQFNKEATSQLRGAE